MAARRNELRSSMVTGAPRAKAIRDARSSAESLRLIRGFERFPARLIEKLAHGAVLEQVPAKEVLIREGQIPEALFILNEGMLQQFAGLGAHETTFAIIAAPALIQPHALYRDTAAIASIRTVGVAGVGRIAMPDARRLMDEEPLFAAAVVSHIVAELEGLFSEYKSARMRSGLQRLAAWIVAMQHHHGARAQVTLPFDKTVLAARLGVAPATLSRDFAELRRYGVKVCGRALTVGDPDRLRDLAAVDAFRIPPAP